MCNPNWQLAQSMCQVGQGRLSGSHCSKGVGICCLCVVLVEPSKRMPCFLSVKGWTNDRSQEMNLLSWEFVLRRMMQRQNLGGIMRGRVLVSLHSSCAFLRRQVMFSSPSLSGPSASSLFQCFPFESVRSDLPS